MSFDPHSFIHVRVDGMVHHAYPDRETESVWIRTKKGLVELKPGEYDIAHERKAAE